MPDIPFGGPGRLYDDAPAPSAAFPAPAAPSKPAGVVHADDAAFTQKAAITQEAPPEPAVVETGHETETATETETEKAPAETTPAETPAPEEAH